MFCLSSPDDKVQRMVNAIQPDSYLPPHKHLEKNEDFVALRGRFLALEYDDSGRVKDHAVISPDTPKPGECNGIEVKKNIWHNIIALDKDSVAFEVLDGPYKKDEHKIFPEWAPREEQYSEGMKFVENVMNKLRH